MPNETDDLQLPDHDVPEGVGEATATAAPAGESSPEGSPEATPDQGRGPALSSDDLAQQVAALQSRLAELEPVAAQAAVLREIVARVAGLEPTAAAPRRPPQEQQVLDRLYQLIPELPKVLQLADVAEQLRSLPEVVRSWQQREVAYWDRVAQSHFDAIYQRAAETLTGRPEPGKLDELARAALRHAYVAWIKADPERVDRYTQADGRLIDEFWQAYRAAAVDPLIRNAPASRSATPATRQPRGGSAVGVEPGGATPSARSGPSRAPKRPAPDEEDEAIFADSFRRLQEALSE
jgi:hypothetical protein